MQLMPTLQEVYIRTLERKIIKLKVLMKLVRSFVRILNFFY